MEEWKEYKLKDICIKITDGSHSSPKGLDDGYPMFSVKDMQEYGFDYSKCKYVSYNDFLSLKQNDCVPQKGDILVAKDGSYLKQIFVCKETKDEGILSSIAIFRPNTLVDSFFLCYLLKSPEVYNYIANNCVSGSALPRIVLKDFKEIKLRVPSLAKQTEIVSILKSLDDKIEVNRRINDNFYFAFLEVMLIWLLTSLRNDNLESLAKKLFRLWCLKNSEGTMKLKLADIAYFTSGYSYKGNELVPSNIAMATIKNFDRNGGFKMDGFKEIQPSDKLKESQIAEKFDILVAHTDLTQKAEVIGNAELLLSTGEYDQIIYSMDLVKVKPLANFPYQFLLTAILRTDEFKAHCLGYVNGTTVLHLSKKGLPEYEFAIPSSLSEQREMNTVLGDIYKKQSTIVEESRRLRALRDSILPKLMSGAIKVDVVNM